MTDPLVIVGVSQVDASTEHVQVSQNDRGIWIFNLPQDAGQMTEQAIKQLDPKIREHVHTVITCSTADDSYARHRNVTQPRLRPKDVMSALGITQAMVMNDHLPNLQNLYKTDAACASGLVALDLANLIVHTQNNVVLIAGIDKSTAPTFLNFFIAIGAVARTPEKYHAPFDQLRSGFAMGECAAMLAVTTASQAKARGLDIIATVDTVKNKTILTHPTSPSNPVLLEQFIENTILSSNRSLDDFACWDAHATSTPQGDELEYKIFCNIFKHRDTAISSFKSRIGHCMSSSAVVELVNAIKHVQAGSISPNHNLQQPIANDARLITADTPTQKKTFIKTSFGFGGRNGVTVITVH